MKIGRSHIGDWHQHKRYCEACGWQGLRKDALTAAHPFRLGEVITGCPQCRGAASLHLACDYGDCFEPIACGMPTDAGYRSTCHDHRPD